MLATSGPEEAIGSFQPVPAADLRPGWSKAIQSLHVGLLGMFYRLMFLIFMTLKSGLKWVDKNTPIQVKPIL